MAVNCSMEEPPGRDYPFAGLPYIRSIERAGGIPFLVPALSRPAEAERLAALADAALFTGSDDIYPAFYRQKPHPACGDRVPRGKTRTDLALFRAARARGIPVLAICGGLQLANVACGGTLIQDIASAVPGALGHRSARGAPASRHAVRIEAGTLLARVLGRRMAQVNSYHHQAADRVGRTLRVSARAPDGVVEALEGTEGASLIAVQWHPERMAADDPVQRRLFAWLIRSARAP